MIHFKIQFKAKSKIFIPKNIHSIEYRPPYLVSHSPLFFFGPRSPTCLGHTRTLIFLKWEFFERTTTQLTWEQFEIVFGTALVANFNIRTCTTNWEQRSEFYWSSSIFAEIFAPNYCQHQIFNTTGIFNLRYFGTSDAITVRFSSNYSIQKM